jgi:nucleotide-binding universal stress UspA family protein
MFKKMLVPTDGSDLSSKTVEKAIVFAGETGAAIVFLYAMHEPPIPLSDLSDTAHYEPEKTKKYAEAVQEYASKILNKAVELAKQSGIDAACMSVTDDSPYAAIVRVAEEQACDLIFMASHGRRGLSGLLLGSETHKVLTHSKIPVLIYR